MEQLNLTTEELVMPKKGSYIINERGITLRVNNEFQTSKDNSLSAEHQVILDKIMAWDLSRIKKYMVNKDICSADIIDAIEKEYKRFIFLCVVSQDKNVPISQAVDKMWHTHILFTKNYIDFCNNVRGEYIHHNPTVTDNDRLALKGVYENTTLRLYKEFFGEPNKSFWNKGEQICSEVCDDSPGDDKPVME